MKSVSKADTVVKSLVSAEKRKPGWSMEMLCPCACHTEVLN